jgi:DNA-binding response OmpR family regulator
VGIRDYLTDPAERRSINRAIRRSFDRRRGKDESVARILVVDNDPLTRQTLVRILERASFKVSAAANGDEAVELYDRDGADLVIADIFVPDCNGLETIAALRRRSAETRIIAVSSRPEPEGYLKAVASFGATHSLTKPFDTRQLLEAIQKLLGD